MIKKMRLSTMLIVSLVVLFAGCSDVECNKFVSQGLLDQVDQGQLAIDQKIIDDYIISNNLGSSQNVNGITVITKQAGSGGTPCLENEVTVTYEGKLLSNSTVFDSNFSGATFPLNGLILGWQLSFPSFQKGTEATIFIPSGYGYGPSGFSPRIPPNANLIFDLTIVKIR